jgi:hypothetical protein
MSNVRSGNCMRRIVLVLGESIYAWLELCYNEDRFLDRRRIIRNRRFGGRRVGCRVMLL